MSLILRLTDNEKSEREKHLDMIASKLWVEGLRYSTFTIKKAKDLLKNTVASRYNMELVQRFPYRIKMKLRQKQVNQGSK